MASQGSAFYFVDINRMLIYGSFIYALSFITSFPVFYRLDEKANESWGIGKTILTGFAANGMAILLYDITTKIIGHI